MKAEVRNNVATNDYTVMVHINPTDLVGAHIDLSEAFAQAAKEIAEDYIRNNKADILAAMNPIAISNLAIAESAQLVRKAFIDPKKSKPQKSNQ